jgi:hypothetical protein
MSADDSCCRATDLLFLLLLLQTRDGNKPHEQLLLIMHEDRVGYCQFDGQVKLRKRKRQPGDEPRPEKVRQELTVHVEITCLYRTLLICMCKLSWEATFAGLLVCVCTGLACLVVCST